MTAELRLLVLAAGVATFACIPADPICGDGKVDPPEACDDGNTQSGDGCSPACQLPGTPTQCITLLRGDGTIDDQVDVVLPLGDEFVAAGSLNMDGAVVAWVGKWHEQGERIWLRTLAAGDGETRLRDITVDGSTGYWVALNSSGTAELAHLDEFGSVGERTSLPDASIRRVRWIDGRLWVAGSLQDDLWLAVLDNGSLETSMLEDHLGYEDTIRDGGRWRPSARRRDTGNQPQRRG